MLEYYGWVNLSDSTYESDDREMELIVNKVSAFIDAKQMLSAPGLLKIQRVNGASQLLVSGKTNHLSRDVQDVFELYDYIAAIGQGSYGLLYIRNDDAKEANNEFTVYVLARGRIRKERDPFLSPCMPVIEDDEI